MKLPSVQTLINKNTIHIKVDKDFFSIISKGKSVTNYLSLPCMFKYGVPYWYKLQRTRSSRLSLPTGCLYHFILDAESKGLFVNFAEVSDAFDYNILDKTVAEFYKQTKNKSINTVLLPNGYNGSTVLCYAEPIECKNLLVKLEVVGIDYLRVHDNDSLVKWVGKSELAQAIKEQNKEPT